LRFTPQKQTMLIGVDVAHNAGYVVRGIEGGRDGGGQERRREYLLFLGDQA